MSTERDYVLGTHDEEIARLGLQHRVWRPVVLDCWQKAGITVGKRVLDVGAGPGYATMDLAEIVGPTGQVTAIERSSKFVQALKESCRARSLKNVQIHELDLMTDQFPDGPFDFCWCRWVLSFVSKPAVLMGKLAAVTPTGGVVILHEYADYETWRFAPRRPNLERFAKHVGESWRASGGEPDIALDLPSMLTENGFIVRSAVPRIFCVRPGDYMWEWPAAFIDTYPSRLQEMLGLEAGFPEKLRAELTEAEATVNSLMITPLVLEIVAEKCH